MKRIALVFLIGTISTENAFPLFQQINLGDLKNFCSIHKTALLIGGALTAGTIIAKRISTVKKNRQKQRAILIKETPNFVNTTQKIYEPFLEQNINQLLTEIVGKESENEYSIVSFVNQLEQASSGLKERYDLIPDEELKSSITKLQANLLKLKKKITATKKYKKEYHEWLLQQKISSLESQISSLSCELSMARMQNNSQH